MRMRAIAIVCGALLGWAWIGPVFAQDQAAYQGRYQNDEYTTLIIAERPDDHALFAVLNGGHYLLRPVRADVYLDPTGSEVHFARDREGRVIGYRVGAAETVAQAALHPLLDASARIADGAWHARPAGAPETYEYAPPEETQDGMGVAALRENDPLRAQLGALTQAIYNEEFPGVDSLLVMRGGALAFEQYFHEFGRETPHQMRSATKTLMALLVGAAMDRDLIENLDAPVLPYFPEYADLQNVDARKRAIRLRDLLSMQSGFACNDWDRNSPGNETRMGQSDDWARFMLDLPMASAPGERGSYCSGNVILIGRIIEKATGQSLRDFASEVLFAPLGIENFEWNFAPNRSNAENFCQAWLTPRDMARIGALILDHGAWGGRQVIFTNWIDEMTGQHSAIDDTPYGYFWWRRYINTPAGRVETAQASGNGGQKIIVMPAYDAVIVFTGGNYNQDTDVNAMMARYILPGLAGSAAQP